MLKCEFHTHTNDDPIDGHWVQHSVYQLIDRAQKLNFDVLGVTCHNLLLENEKVVEYAKEKEILLLPGVELDVKGKHTLIYGASKKEIEGIKSLDDLRDLRKRKNVFVIAAHPFHKAPSCHGDNVIKYLDVFDAWEFNFLHTKVCNPNKKTLKLAKRYNKPIVGNSDVHVLKDLGRTYTLIDSKKDQESIFKAIKNHKVKVVTKPLPLTEFVYVGFKALFSTVVKKLKRQVGLKKI